MAQPLRKSLVLEVLGEEITVEVDFRLIDIMERVFNQSADMIVARFVVVEDVQRRYIADIVADLVSRKADVKFKRSDVREAIITAEADAHYQTVLKLQSALLFILRHMSGDEYDKTMAELAEGSKKKTTSPGSAEPSSDPATK